MRIPRLSRVWLIALMLLTASTAQAQTMAEIARALDAPQPVLTGVIVLDSVDAVRAAGWTDALPGRVDVSRVPLLDRPEVLATLSAAVGQPLTLAAIEEVRAQVARFFASAGRPFVRVIVPPQDATNGVVQIVATEGRLAAVRVEGARFFGEQAYLGAVDLASGQPIDARRLDRGIEWLNSNPYRQVTPLAVAGAEPGTTDIVLRVADRRPIAVTATAGNTGNPHNGEVQLGTSFDYGNVFGRGDLVNARYTTSADGVINQFGGGYVAGMPGRNTLSINGSYARTRPDSQGSDIGNVGTSSGISARYGWRAARMTFGVDFRRTDNDVLFGGDTVFATAAGVTQFSADYSRPFNSRAGISSLYVSGIFSPGDLGPFNTDAAFEEQRVGATARYAYLRAAVGHTGLLRGGLTWDVRATGQVANARLLSSEQMGFGGEGSLRGFDPFAASRDRGVVVNAEVRLPALSGLLRGRREASRADQLVFFGFADYGTGTNKDEDAGSLSLLSVGPGLRYQMGRQLSAQVAYGHALRQVGLPEAKGHRWHFQVVAGY